MEYPRRRSCLLGVAAIFLLMQISAEAQTEPVPPAAPVKQHRETRHGATVVDNYFWLREKSNPEVAHYLEAENAYTESMTKSLKPFEDSLYQEMLSHIKQTDENVPYRKGDYLYYSRTEEGTKAIFGGTNPAETNTISAPIRILPVKTSLQGIKSSFRHIVPGYAIEVLAIPIR